MPDRSGYNGSDLPFLDQPDRSMEGAVEAASFVLALRARGIGDTAVLRAMELVPREIFAPRTFSDLSRTDVALPLPCGQTMTAPRAVAAMLVARVSGMAARRTTRAARRGWPGPSSPRRPRC